MENRIAHISFSRHVLHTGFSKDDFIAMLNELPEDTTIIDFFEDYTRDQVNIRVKSSCFKLVYESHNLPKITAKFTRHNNYDEDGVGDNYTICELDMSEALDLGNTTTTLESKEKDKKFSNGSSYSSFKDLEKKMLNEEISISNREMSKVFEDMNLYGQGAVKIEYDADEFFKMDHWNVYSIPEKDSHIASIQLPSGYVIDSDTYKRASTEMTCEHTWVPYEGLTSKYNYCSKCDAKQD